jgi:type VI secretion system protein ImpH
MATEGGAGPDDLSHIARLAREPQSYHLFQALRVLEAHYADQPRLGESRRAHEDKVRLGQEAELAFPPSTIASFELGKGDKPSVLINRFFGLFGPHGPLPIHLTEYARDRFRNHRDPTLVAFADMLTHRLLGLLYRAWASAEPAPNYDRDEDPYSAHVASFIGWNGDELGERDAAPDNVRLHYSGHLGREPRNAEGLVSILSGYLDMPVTLEQFIGSWLELEPDDQWEMGGLALLGQNASVGTKVWSRTSKFRIRIGPLKLEDYQKLLPGSDALAEIRGIVRTYIGEALDWDLQLVLAGDEIPRASLGGTTRLGLTSWTGSKQDPDEVRPDAEDLFLHPSSMERTAAA